MISATLHESLGLAWAAPLIATAWYAGHRLTRSIYGNRHDGIWVPLQRRRR